MFTVCGEAPRCICGFLDWVIVHIDQTEVVTRDQSLTGHGYRVDVCSILTWGLDTCAILAQF